MYFRTIINQPQKWITYTDQTGSFLYQSTRYKNKKFHSLIKIHILFIPIIYIQVITKSQEWNPFHQCLIDNNNSQ